MKYTHNKCHGFLFFGFDFCVPTSRLALWWFIIIIIMEYDPEHPFAAMSGAGKGSHKVVPDALLMCLECQTRFPSSMVHEWRRRLRRGEHLRVILDGAGVKRWCCRGTILSQPSAGDD